MTRQTFAESSDRAFLDSIREIQFGRSINSKILKVAERFVERLDEARGTTRHCAAAAARVTDLTMRGDGDRKGFTIEFSKDSRATFYLKPSPAMDDFFSRLKIGDDVTVTVTIKDPRP